MHDTYSPPVAVPPLIGGCLLETEFNCLRRVCVLARKSTSGIAVAAVAVEFGRELSAL